MASIKCFEDLECWKLARELCQFVFRITSKGDFVKDFELKNQIKKSSGSSMDNIAEGFERDGNREFINFLSISKGSVGEVRSQLYRAFDQKYISEEEFKEGYELATRVSQADKGLMTYLKNSEFKGEKFYSKS